MASTPPAGSPVVPSQPSTAGGDQIDFGYFARMVVELHAQPTAARTIDRIAEYARSALDCDEAGILRVHSRRRIETAAATVPRVGQAHSLQLALDEGPCLDAIGTPRAYMVGDARESKEYPRWGPAIADLGIASVLSLPLQTKARRYGALNLYSEQRDALDERDLEVAPIFARHASVALAAADE